MEYDNENSRENQMNIVEIFGEYHIEVRTLYLQNPARRHIPALAG